MATSGDLVMSGPVGVGSSFASPGSQGPAGPAGPKGEEPLVTLGSLYRPPTGGMHPTVRTKALPLGDLSSFNNAVSFWAYDDANQKLHDWYNKQGHTWVKPPGSTTIINATTTRVYKDDPSTPQASSGELEVLYNGKEIALVLLQQGNPLVDVVFGTVEEDGVIYRLPDQDGSSQPGSGYRQYHWMFDTLKSRKIRLFLPVSGWHSIIVESSDEIGYAPDRPLVPVVSDSYTDASGWGRYTWTKEYQILTGFRTHESGQGSTGWRNNGAGQDSEAPGNDANVINRYYYFHNIRFNKLAEQALGIDHNPLVLLTNGSGNDAAWCSDKNYMKSRFLESFDKVKAYDPDCRIVSISWEPVTAFAGPAQEIFDQAMAEAHAEHSSSAGVVFPCNDHGRRWFSGGGTVANVPTPATSESMFVSPDTVHLDPKGPATNYYAQKIAETTRNFKVPAKRAVM